jgi:hypothetical protein
MGGASVTVAIGMICSDGVLVASDSMGSSGRIATTMDKVHSMSSRASVWTYAGSTFVGQRVEAALADERVGSNSGRMKTLQGVINEAYGEIVLPPGATPKDIVTHGAEVLLLDWNSDGPFFQRLHPDMTVVDCRDQRLVAIGTGKEYAAVVRASLGQYLLREITLHHGTLIAHRVITTVCNVSAWGVAPPVQIAVADDDGARVLTADQVEELGTLVQRWVETESRSLEIARSTPFQVARDLPLLPQAEESGDAS